ncbi:MAG: hypothetical protein IJS56_00775 [Bacilli bacterium]|nr:hypothetical protein [Bacilli bacterium]
MKEKDLEFFQNIYMLLQSKESNYNDLTTMRLNDYFKSFLDNYSINSCNSEEYLGNEESYKTFMDNFLSVYKNYQDKENMKYVIPLFIYLYDQDQFGFNMNKFNSFVENEEISSFNDLLANYDVYTLNEKTI